MDLEQLVDTTVNEFRKDPRNKVFASEELLLASAEEETGGSVTADRLRDLIRKYEEGEIDDDEQEIVDGALYACSLLARKCFGEDPEDEEEEVDYDITFLENDDGSFSVEIRPS